MRVQRILLGIADNRLSKPMNPGYTVSTFAPEGRQLFYSAPAVARMKQLNFDHGGRDPWSTMQLVLWIVAAVLAGIVFVLFLARS
jgi:hypothetical protein